MSTVHLRSVATARQHVAVLEYEPRRSRGVCIVAGHGYSSSKQNLDLLCAFLSAQGFRVFNLDFPGHKLGASGGRLDRFDDAISAMSGVAAYVLETHAQTTYALGHSMGAMTALRVAAREPRIAGAISIATGWGRSRALESLGGLAVDLRSSYVDGMTLPALVADAAEGYADDLAKLHGRPVLYVGATRDAMVSRESARELYDRAPEPKTLRMIDSDHTYAGENAKAEVLAWLNELHPRA